MLDTQDIAGVLGRTSRAALASLAEPEPTFCQALPRERTAAQAMSCLAADLLCWVAVVTFCLSLL